MLKRDESMRFQQAIVTLDGEKDRLQSCLDDKTEECHNLQQINTENETRLSEARVGMLC
ncbi:unnamed protein product [Protopolystoma xenopodis]|uniref:Uncharacterized protein n=1 Tax=Protopolystoma xenopodis TaxID=117903 RepID=A0A448WXS0_9PLAT|nr:unnamed protein product [Protopolystoma xenopodis]